MAANSYSLTFLSDFPVGDKNNVSEQSVAMSKPSPHRGNKKIYMITTALLYTQVHREDEVTTT